MHDKTPASDEIADLVGALKIVSQDPDEQYYEYIYELVDDIPFLSLWDACIVFAKYIAYGGSIPDCIKVGDLNLLFEAIEDASNELPVLLKPIQQWLSDQLIKSIDEKEIKPKIVGRFLDGKLNAKRTYIDDGQIYEWLKCRNIEIDDNDENFFYDNSSFLERIHDDILGVAKILKARAYDPCFEIPTIDSRETYHLVVENAQLKAQVSQASNPSQFIKKTHGNAERFAKKREEVLGAALSVLTQWPNQCQNNSGKFEATKIAKLIDEKSLLYWPKTGEAPLGREKMEREISRWINGGTAK